MEEHDQNENKAVEFTFKGHSTLEEQAQKAAVQFTFTAGPNMDELCSEINSLKLRQSEGSPGNAASEGQKSKDEAQGSPLSKSEKSPAESKYSTGEGEESSDDDDDASNASYSTAGQIDIEVPDSCMEGENLIVEYRAKLFRFDGEKKEWVERGLGKINLLQSLHDYKKCRVVMWREGNGLLACNFRLFPGFQVTNFQNNPKALCWKCFDSCLGSEWETFTCRFKTEEECTDFKDKLTQYSTDPPDVSPIISLILESIENGNADPGAEGDKADDESHSDCTGCRGCNPSEYEFPAIIESREDEDVISCALNEDACKDLPSIVSPNMFN